MAVIIKGDGGLNANVDSNHNLNINAPMDCTQSGVIVTASEVHNGATGSSRLVRQTDISPDYRTRVGMDTPLWNDVFSHTQFNTSKYIGVESTMTKVLNGGRLAFNGGNSVASGAVARVQTWRSFPLYLSYALYADFEILFTQAPVTNNVCEFGLGYASGITTPTDGIFFR